MPRPVSALILSIAAAVLAPIGTVTFVIAIGVTFDGLRHFHRDSEMKAAQEHAVAHLQLNNPQDVNRLRDFRDRLNRTEHMLFRWRDQLILSGAAIGGGVVLLAGAIAPTADRARALPSTRRAE
jgi:hypothetical protein